MPKEFGRTERLGELIKRELALLIQREIKDPRLGMVVVTELNLAKDLSYAKVYVTALGDEAVVKQQLDILRHAAGFLRSQLAKRIKARTIPQLDFIYDDSIVKGNRLSKLIDQAVAKDEHNEDK
jgi:ribosome-binding factor A